MAKIKQQSQGTNRREFLSGAGAALSFGAVTGLAGPVLPAVGKSIYPAAARIEHDPSLCAGCGVCSLMCSLYHEGEANVNLSRSELFRDPFEGTFSVNLCRQCLSPSCYEACPKKDTALRIDAATGIKYVDAAMCDGCGECIPACPLTPPGIRLNPGKNVAFNCDLCRGRGNGPICIEYCGQKARKLVPGKAEA